MGQHRKGKHTPGGNVSMNTGYVGRHIDDMRQPTARTTRGRQLESLDDSAFGDIADELDRGGMYDKK